MLAFVLACPLFAFAEPTNEREAVTSIASGELTSEHKESAEEKTLPAALKGETAIEKLTIAYDEAQQNLRAAEALIAKLQAQIDELEAVLPAQEERSNAAIKQRYIMQSNPLSMAEPLLSAESLGDFFRHFDYLQIVSKSNLEEFNKTVAMKNELDMAKQEQIIVRDTTKQKADEAEEELKAEQRERAEKAAKGQATSTQQARSIGGKKSKSTEEADDEDEDADEEDEDDEADDEDDEDADEEDEDDEEKPDSDEATQDTEALIDGADWYAPRDEFIEEWAERLDAYLKGTPLEGQGVNFAASAWKYCIDPRWSAAISNTESSKGAFCIRPHNAWGWGAADSDPYGLASEWASWEEAIDAHAAGLAKGYGYTISMRGAQSYCPPTWQSWYNKTLSEMAKI